MTHRLGWQGGWGRTGFGAQFWDWRSSGDCLWVMAVPWGGAEVELRVPGETEAEMKV